MNEGDNFSKFPQPNLSCMLLVNSTLEWSGFFGGKRDENAGIYISFSQRPLVLSSFRQMIGFLNGSVNALIFAIICLQLEQINIQ